MKIKVDRKARFRSALKRITTIALALSSIAFATWMISLGLLPSLYIGLLIAGLLIVNILVNFLLYKRFMRADRSAKTVAVIIVILTLTMMGLGYKTLSSGIRTLDMISSGESVDINVNQPFSVYISGIDTSGDISNVSRSDVNIVATINPNTRQVLLTSIPRDSYVPIALGGNDEMDKLTHAGIYGVDSSMQTLANLLDTEINNYVRINFTTFISSIDNIGGITVNNPVAFESNGIFFDAGNIELNGAEALVYSRERYNLAAGDLDRGKNQQRVIQGFINKVTSIRSLSEYEALLGIVGGAVDTNLSSADLRELMNQQIRGAGGWETESITLTGQGQTGGLPSYAMPGQDLYVYVLDENSVESARQKIDDYLQR